MPILSVNEVADKSFDYIVLGGGTAGLTLAALLSEDPNKTILVLEAGNANIDDPAVLRPASWGSHFNQEKYDWAHKTVPQKYADGVEYPWPRGKGLGGSSAINFMCWTRPPVNEIDEIEKLGNPGWNWTNLNNSLKKVERFVGPSKESAEKDGLRVEGWPASTEGAVATSFPGLVLEADKAVQKSFINLGWEHAKNPTGGDPKGVYFAPQSVDPATWTRSYSTNAFYLPAKDRKNLSVTVDALVTRIVTEKDADGKVAAKSVEFLNGDAKYTVKVGKEVILSAGSIKSPQILELSGIGKKEVLEAAKVPVVLDLPGVGENMQEHVYTSLSFELKDDVTFDTPDVLREPGEVEKHLALHAEGKGLFTTGIMGFSFGPLQQYSERADEIHKAQAERIEKNKDKYAPGIYEQLQVQLRRLKERAPGCEVVNVPAFLSFPNPPKPKTKYWSLLPAMNHNFSRGNVHITSSDPKADPAIDPRYFEEQIDLDTLLEVVKYVRKLAEVSPFKDLIVGEVNPGPNVTTDEQLIDWIKKYMATTYHTASTLSMLPKEKGGVVDPDLRVYGTSNIRVCDLSILPLHFAAHPLAAVYSFAARGAEIIGGGN